MEHPVSKILYVGSLDHTSNSYRRFFTLEKMGYDVHGINTDVYIYQKNYFLIKLHHHLNIGPGVNSLNKYFVKRVDELKPDLIWVDHLFITLSSLKLIRLKYPSIRIIAIVTDDPFGKQIRGWQIFKKTAPLYDIHFVQRLQNINEIKSLGASRVEICYRSFDSEIHKPVTLSPQEKTKYGAHVGFIGSYAPYRAEVIAWLINQGISVSVFGNGWDGKKFWKTIKLHYKGKGIMGEEYTKAINALDIALHFLRKENRDEQDSRTFEIPACGTFMLAEESELHRELFIDKKEAVFFNRKEELPELINYFTDNPELRESIAFAGRKRSIESGYDHQSRLSSILNKVNSL